ncbi:histidine phosphatase family protein [Haliangium ochraceum]|uniref:Phosphoglycerate mutase n=1 Tax=Haliangium ochraceum (strain DSM 14365 / JCM 11303 / SMP-2) TaxID=502025 RepID=D0LN30_HALO1|nr:histidine phosphatase family protein [Haliangium ochraceum]ACY13401.1 Phosphoglycerate mutase [Haliangium ochraceum DSM 14365]
MSADTWRIPPSTLRLLGELRAPVAVLLRHSVREGQPSRDVGYTLPITETGTRLAEALGAYLGERLRTLRTSPLPRCTQTAAALRAGAGVDIPITNDPMLGDPGAFVIDGRRAASNWQERGHESVMHHLVNGEGALPGMADPEAAARFLVQHMLGIVDDLPGVHVFVSHDALVMPTAARLLGTPMRTEDWPWYLEGAYFWREAGQVHVAYRERRTCLERVALCSLKEREVIDFARREVARTIGLNCKARFFLAGGAFKSLLTGRPPRDLDVWAPSSQDREMLRNELMSRGAHILEERPFAEAFEIDGRVVELPHAVAPTTLEERLARFDIALSAVGVEHQPGDQWRAVVAPRVHTSIERREILLLEPLANWKYALATLERVRRYADELGYAVPASAESEVWRIFDAQPAEMKHGMVERYQRAASGGYGVLEEVARRLR